MKNNSKYKYIKENSIIYAEKDEYSLTEHEFFCVYSFYVTYSMCGSQSFKKRSFSDYGWNDNLIEQTIEHKKVKTELGKALSKVIDLKNDRFCFFTDKNNLDDLFKKCNLLDGSLSDYDTERAVISDTNESNKYLKLFYRIRDGFAHGKFLLKYSSTHEKMVIIQDNNTHNVTARIVIKLSTLLSIIETVDINGIIGYNSRQKTVEAIETVA